MALPSAVCCDLGILMLWGREGGGSGGGGGGEESEGGGEGVCRVVYCMDRVERVVKFCNDFRSIIGRCAYVRVHTLYSNKPLN